jgi:hypothetical protein
MYSYMLVRYNRDMPRRVLATEMLLLISTSYISFRPDIVLSRPETGLTYRRETYINLSARTVRFQFALSIVLSGLSQILKSSSPSYLP